MSEQEARSCIIAWAQDHFAGKTIPEVEIVTISYDAEFDVWDAQLNVSTSVDNPYVAFFEDAQHKHHVSVISVEY